MVWDYDRAELRADATVHALGVALGLVGGALLLPAASPAERPAVALYLASLLAVLGLSAAYNTWPVSRTKWLLRRFDHAAIFLLIAGTYTPFAARLRDETLALLLIAGLWGMALLGVVLKLAFPGRGDRAAIALYLLMGWSGGLAFDPIAEVLPDPAVVLLVVGGSLYTLGVPFHVWERLRFQNALWHAFVLAAAACHFAAVTLAVTG
ncbi:MAG: hemolysin III family protein [Geminicoccaceae bacterium]|nr:hemolysin III family protein [Geminicoccaceae bacterium]